LAIVLATIAGAFLFALANEEGYDMVDRIFMVLLIASIGIVYRENTLYRQSREGNMLKDPKTKIAANRFVNSFLMRLFQVTPLLYLFIIKYPDILFAQTTIPIILFIIFGLTVNEHYRLYKDKPTS
jgi:hypothetical protein